jgi:hypothetical protein
VSRSRHDIDVLNFAKNAIVEQRLGSILSLVEVWEYGNLVKGPVSTDFFLDGNFRGTKQRFIGLGQESSNEHARSGSIIPAAAIFKLRKAKI